MKLKRQEITRQEAEQITRQLRKDFNSARKANVQLGMDICAAIEKKVPGKLGMKMRDWLRDTFKESPAKLYALIQTTEKLRGIPVRELEEIPATSAPVLAKLPEPKRHSPGWVKKAQSLPVNDFKEAVAVELERAHGVPREQYRRFDMVVTKDILEEMLEAEKKVARLHSLDIEMKPELRMVVWSRIAALINTTEEALLMQEMEGDESGQNGRGDFQESQAVPA